MNYFTVFLWDPIKKYFDEIQLFMFNKYELLCFEDYQFEIKNKKTILNFIKSVYLLDNGCSHEYLQYKLNSMLKYKKRGIFTIRYLKINIDNPNWIKKNNKIISKSSIDIKEFIRNKYKNKILGYVKDIIIHVCDNHKESNFTDKLINYHFKKPKIFKKQKINLILLFHLLNKHNYVLLKMDDDFPNYKIRGDFNLLVNINNLNNIIKIILHFGKIYTKNRWNIVVKPANYHEDFKNENNRYFVDFWTPKNKIELRIDIITSDYLSRKQFYIDTLNKKISVIIDNTTIFVPRIDYDITIRYVEFLQHKHKFNHFNYINQYPESMYKYFTDIYFEKKYDMLSLDELKGNSFNKRNVKIEESLYYEYLINKNQNNFKIYHDSLKNISKKYNISNRNWNYSIEKFEKLYDSIKNKGHLDSEFVYINNTNDKLLLDGLDQCSILLFINNGEYKIKTYVKKNIHSLIDFYIKENDYQKSIDEIDKYIFLRDKDLYYKKAMCHYKLNNYHKSIKMYSNYFEIYPDIDKLFINTSLVLKNKNNFKYLYLNFFNLLFRDHNISNHSITINNNNRFKILFLDTNQRDYTLYNFKNKLLGGTETCLCNLLLTLCEYSQISYYFGNHHPKTYFYKDISCFSIKNGLHHDTLMDINPDIVITISNIKCCKILTEYTNNKLGKNIPIYCWFHHDIDQKQSLIFNNKNYFKYVDGMIYVSEWQRKEFINNYTYPIEKSFVLNNAISPMFLNHNKNMILNNKKPIMAYTSTPFRGLHLLSKIFPIVKKHVQELQLYIFSSMKIYDQGDKDKMYADMYEQFKEMDGVHYFGSVTQLELLNHLQKVLILGYPNIFRETFCLSVVEGMSQGCYVISSNLGALPEVTDNFATLIDYNKHNENNYIEEFSNEIIRVINLYDNKDSGLENHLQKQIQHVQKNYDWNNRVDDFCNIISKNNIYNDIEKIISNPSQNKEFLEKYILKYPKNPTINLLQLLFFKDLKNRINLPKHTSKIYEILNKKNLEESTIYDISKLFLNILIPLYLDNAKEYQISLANYYIKYFPKIFFENPNIKKLSEELKQKSTKIRIGFISKYFKSHSSGKLIRGLINLLPKNKYHKSLFIVEGTGTDHITKDLIQNTDESFVLKENIFTAQQFISKQNLHVIIYPEIGQSMLCYLLAFSRLSPVQCVHGWGHPVTTGIPNIDYFILLKDDKVDRKEVEKYYTEKLIFQNLSSYYYEPNIKDVSCLREYAIRNNMDLSEISKNKIYNKKDFGLQESNIVYLCVQNSLKITRNLIDVSLKILKHIPNSNVVFIGDNSYKIKNNRMLFIPKMKHRDILGLVSISDVILDSIGWCGGITSMEAFALNKPIVTYPFRSLKGRITDILYQRMNIFECSANNMEEYFKIAIKLSNKKFNKNITDKIKSNKNKIFEVSSVIKEWEKFMDKK